MKISNNNISKIGITILVIIYTFLMELVNHSATTVSIFVAVELFIVIINIKNINKKIFLFFLYNILILSFNILINPEYSKDIIYTALIFINLLLTIMIWELYLKKDSDERLEFSLKNFSLFGMILSIMVIIESFIKKNIFFGFMSRADSSLKIGKYNYVCYGSMGNHIVLSIYLTFILIETLYLYRKTNERKYLIMCLINLISLILTGARTAYIVLAILIFISVFEYLIISIFKKRINKNMLKKIFIILIITCILYMIFQNYVNTIYNRFYLLFNGREQASLTHRISSIRVALHWIMELNPFEILFGKGFGMLTLYLKNNNLSAIELSNFYVIDNQFVSLLYNNGIIIFVIVIIQFIKNLFNKKLFLKDEKSSIMIQSLMIMIILFLFSFDGFTWMASTSVIGVIYAITDIINEKYFNKNLLEEAKK